MLKLMLSALAGILLVALSVCSRSGLYASTNPQVQPRISGAYSDMRVIEDAGDVVGTEIKMVYAEDHFQGELQFAEGTPGRPVLVNVIQEGSAVTSAVPHDSELPGSFTGEVSDGLLRGTFHFKDGGTEAIVLRRGKSYWD